MKRIGFISLSLWVALWGVCFAGEGRRPPDFNPFGGDLRRLPFAMGRVTAISGKTITLEMPSGQRAMRTVVVTDKTKIVKPSEGKVSDIKKGARVIASGAPSSDAKTIEVRQIMLNPPQPRPLDMQRPRDFTSGEVAGDSTLTLKTSDGKTVAVKIKKGARITVGGAPSSDGKTIEARSVNVFALPSGRNLAMGLGSIAAGVVTNTSPLTVKTNDGRSVTLKATQQTRVMATKNLTLADVKVGEMVSVNGRPKDNGDLEAEFITIQSGMAVPSRFSGPGTVHPGGTRQPRR